MSNSLKGNYIKKVKKTKMLFNLKGAKMDLKDRKKKFDLDSSYTKDSMEKYPT